MCKTFEYVGRDWMTRPLETKVSWFVPSARAERLSTTWGGNEAEESKEDKGEGNFIVATITQGNLVE
jgi:hypothetical protein